MKSQKVIAVVSGILVLGVLSARTQAPTQKVVQKLPASEKKTLPTPGAISAITFSPKRVTLIAGGDPVAVSVSNAIVSSVSFQVMRGGQPAPGVTAYLDKGWPASSKINFRAGASAPRAADYTLRISATLSNQQKIVADIPSNQFGIEVIEPLYGLKVTRISPASGERGIVATLDGHGFLLRSTLTVNFTANNVQNQSAQILEKTDTSLKVKVPPGAESGKIRVISGQGRDFEENISPFSFTVLQPPTIESFYPTGGPPGTKVEIHGYNFATPSGPQFKFFNEISAFLNSAGGQVEATDRGPLQNAFVIVPKGATSGPIKVLTSYGTAVSNQDFQVTTVLTSPPVITQFTPGGGKVGTEVTISGLNFGQDVSGVTVMFGSQPSSANPSFCSNESIRINVPAGGTTGKISVRTSDGEGKSAGTFYLSPEITSVSPNQGPPGYQVYIKGKNFDFSDISVNIVKFNGIQAKVVSLGGTGTALTVEVPTSATSGYVTVETPGGTATSPQVFTVVR